MTLNLVLATDQSFGIGKNGAIPWPNKDLAFFKRLTVGKQDDGKRKNAVIMGRKTFDSITTNCVAGRLQFVQGQEWPLVDRFNYVASRTNGGTQTLGDGSSLESLIETVKDNPNVCEIFIIGGAEIYKTIFEKYPNKISQVYWTKIPGVWDCDTFTTIPNYFNPCSTIDPATFNQPGLQILAAKNVQEYVYLDTCRDILAKGQRRQDRTGTGTISTFGVKMEFDISETIPILTTRKISWKIILKELLWFISGSTDSTILERQGVNIWKGNTSREFLDSRGLFDLPVGNIGLGYGHCWRNFGGQPGKPGVDQLKNVINMIKTDPTSRRIILSAWNPCETDRIALPPCHILVQWYVRKDPQKDSSFLDCQLYQRSGDMALGVPFNIASYSMLTYIISKLTGCKPGRFIHIIGDAHIYENHVPGVTEQLTREPGPWPRFQVGNITDIDSLSETDFDVVGYHCHPVIKMPMAV